MAPSKRTAYALFMKDQHPIERARLFPGVGKLKLRAQRQITSSIGKAWKKLSNAQKNVYQRRSKQEVQDRAHAIQEMKGIPLEPVPEGKNQPDTVACTMS